MIKVSVIVPVYNGEAHLRECLDSIAGQTLKDIEIICVDDGSEDSSYEILNEYKEKDLRFQVYRQENKYAGAARNLGKSHAKGEYLAFWDCDDFFNPDALEKLYNRAKSVNADVCVCGGNQFLESKQKLYPWPPYLSVKFIPEEGTFNRFTNPDRYLNFTNAAAWNKLFKREYIEGLNLDFQPIRNGNDVYFTVNALGLADRITVCNERLVNYRVNQDSGLVCSLSKSPLSPVKAWIDIAENLEKHDGFGVRSFANKALGSMIYMLQNISEWDAFREAVEALKEYALKKMHIFPHDDDFYYGEWNGECVKHLYNDTPEEFAVFFANSVYIQKAEAFAEKRALNVTLSEKKEKNKELAAEKKEIKKELKASKKEIKELKKKNDDLKKEKESLEKNLTETKEALEKTKNDFEVTRSKLEKSYKDMTKIKNSWSFKIGKVIVWLPGKIKKIFKK